MKYIPESVVLRQSPTSTRGILRPTSRQWQKRKCHDMYQAFRRPAFDANKIAFLFFKGKLYSILAKTFPSSTAETPKKKNNNKTLFLIEAHQLIGILPPSICTSPPRNWQPEASLLPLWWQQRNRDHATGDHHYRAARDRSSHKWSHSLGGQWNKITLVIQDCIATKND